VYGDIYNTYHVHSQDDTGGPVPSSVHSRKGTDNAAKLLMDALAFGQMDTRIATISTAHAQTCQWLFAREEYTSWRDPEALHRHHGFFWIKGKPGAGKSTLMKCAHQYGRDTHEDLSISFFFNARGELLQKSAEGMYRSLLYQLLDAIPALVPVLGNYRQRATDQSWPLAELEDMLAKVVKALSSNAVTCYIDALDECNDEEARKIIEHFESLVQCAVKADTEFRVLLSSRHYPLIRLDDCIELNLEDQQEHEADVAEYIRCKLKIGKGRLSLEIHDAIQMRACGVFLWVVLVIRILNECDARGKTHLLKKRLATIPDGLSELFEEILQRGTYDSNDTLLTLQWILFAQRPLRPEELYFAVTANSNEDAFESWDHDEITPDVMERFLLDSSKGLAEMTKGRNQTVQFIHESVRDYLLDQGLAAIQPMLSEDVVSISHEHLKICCLHYLEKRQSAILCASNDGVKALMSRRRRKVIAMQIQVAAAHPFLSYAIKGILYHANLAHSTSRPQNAFVTEFPHGIWRRYHNICCHLYRHRMSIETQPLYTFVAMGAFELARIEIQKSSSRIEDRLKGEHHRTLLCAAVDNEDHSTMNLLLDNGAVPNDHSRPPASSCLALAIEKKDSLMVRTLIDNGAGPICAVPGIPMVQYSLQYALQEFYSDQSVIDCILSRAPYSDETGWLEVLTEALFISRDRGYQSTESSLLARLKAAINELARSSFLATVATCGDAFVAACGHGELALVRTLMDNVDMRRSEKYVMAFEAAMKNGHIETVRLLLNNGIMADLPVDGIGTAATSIASERGHEGIVRLLLEHGAC
jgi:hypothetical protein